MSCSCFRTCTLVFIYCAVLFAQVSCTISDRDSLLAKTRNTRSENIRSINVLYRNHPSLRNAVLTDNMRSLLVSLKRRKRIPHHGRSSKVWRTTRAKASNERKTTRAPPLINVNDIESPISRQKHQCRFLQYGNDLIALDHYEIPRQLVRRAAIAKSTSSSTGSSISTTTKTTTHVSSTKDTKDKRQAEEVTTAVEVPVIITEIVEVGAPAGNSKKWDEFSLLRRQVSDDAQTTCVTVTGPLDNITQGGGGDVTVAPNGGSDTSVSTNGGGDSSATTATTAAVISTAESATTQAVGPTPPALQLNADVEGGKVTVGQPSYEAMVTTPGALMAAQQPPIQVGGTTIDPGKFSETLDAILEDVESLADQKITANEDFPCHVNGSWISEAGGVRLEISLKDNSTLDVTIEDAVGKSRKNNQQGFLSNSSWSLTGSVPLGKKSMVILNAVNDNENQIATFIGECKVCHHTETMAGHWLHVKSARDCNDQKDSFRILSDLWRRETLHGLKKQRIKLHTTTTSTSVSNATLTTCIVYTGTFSSSRTTLSSSSTTAATVTGH